MWQEGRFGSDRHGHSCLLWYVLPRNCKFHFLKSLQNSRAVVENSLYASLPDRKYEMIVEDILIKQHCKKSNNDELIRISKKIIY